eukprot:gene11918-2484_t
MDSVIGKLDKIVTSIEQELRTEIEKTKALKIEGVGVAALAKSALALQGIVAHPINTGQINLQLKDAAANAPENAAVERLQDAAAKELEDAAAKELEDAAAKELEDAAAKELEDAAAKEL